MDVITALETRKSVRAYLDTEVSKKTIEQILQASRHAPSGVNTQPWKVAVLTGDAKQRLSDAMVAAFKGGVKPKMDYNYYPIEWKEPYKARRKECGLLMYSTLNITREDKERQLEQWAKNYMSFDAPVMLLFFIDKDMKEGSFLDYGMFLQSVMLSATSLGLATCPQAALGEYPDIVRSELGVADNWTVLCGISLGYEDTDDIINSYKTTREDTNNFVTYFS